jgi:hypothetical protein
MRGVKASRDYLTLVIWRINQWMGGVFCFLGVVFAGLTMFYGGWWLIRARGYKSKAIWRIGLQCASPLVAMVSPILIRILVYPHGFWSI